MRLTLRLLTLALLLSVATFTSMLSPVSKADFGSPCTDGCANGYDSCRKDCSQHPACGRDCNAEFNACYNKCGRPADFMEVAD